MSCKDELTVCSPFNRPVWPSVFLLLAVCCNFASAGPVVWSCSIRLSDMTNPCTLKILMGEQLPRYTLGYGDRRSAVLEKVTQTITPGDSLVSFDMRYFEQPFHCRLQRQEDGSYAGECRRDDDQEIFSLVLDNPLASTQINTFPLVQGCPGD